VVKTDYKSDFLSAKIKRKIQKGTERTAVIFNIMSLSKDTKAM
jgi:hypothetical protein